MKRVISFIVKNQPGVLCRVAGLISRRGFNIDSITVGVTSNPKLSRITVVIIAEDKVVEQMLKQLNKLLDVKAIMEIPKESGTARELALIKVHTGPSKKGFMDVVNSMWGKVLDIGEETTTVQLTGTCDEIDHNIERLREYEIYEIARTGMVALESGDTMLFDSSDQP